MCCGYTQILKTYEIILSYESLVYPKIKTYKINQTYANKENLHGVCTVGFIKKVNNNIEMSRTKE